MIPAPVLGTRTINLADQARLAVLSGDHNPFTWVPSPPEQPDLTTLAS